MGLVGDLLIMTSGRGPFSTEFSHYAPCPENASADAIAKAEPEAKRLFSISIRRGYTHAFQFESNWQHRNRAFQEPVAGHDAERILWCECEPGWPLEFHSENESRQNDPASHEEELACFHT